MEALQYPEMEQQVIQMTQPTLASDKNICQLGEYLKREGMQEEYQSYQNLMHDTDRLGMLLDQMQQLTTALTKEQKAHEETVQKLGEATERISKLEETLTHMHKRMDDYENASVNRYTERFHALQSGFVNLKAGIKERVNDLLLDFKVNGRAALGRVSELLDIKGKLAWMYSCVQNGIYETEKNIDRQNRMHAEYVKAAAALMQVENIKNEDRFLQTRNPVRLILQQREAHIERCKDRMERRKDILGGLCTHLADSIGRIESFEKDAARDRNVRISERLQEKQLREAREDIREAFEIDENERES